MELLGQVSFPVVGHGAGEGLIVVLQFRIAVLVQRGNLLPEVHVQRPVANDQQGAFLALFGRLEDDVAKPLQLARGGQCFTRADIESHVVEFFEIPPKYVPVRTGVPDRHQVGSADPRRGHCFEVSRDSFARGVGLHPVPVDPRLRRIRRILKGRLQICRSGILRRVRSAAVRHVKQRHPRHYRRAQCAKSCSLHHLNPSSC